MADQPLDKVTDEQIVDAMLARLKRQDPSRRWVIAMDVEQELVERELIPRYWHDGRPSGPKMAGRLRGMADRRVIARVPLVTARGNPAGCGYDVIADG